MTIPAALPATVRTYLEELDLRLTDLAPADRAELTAPIEQRMLELVGAGGDGSQIDQRFGSPEQLANDLRTAAGHPAPAPAVPVRAPRVSVTSWLRTGLDRPWVAAVASYLTSLRPAWWAVRGYLLFGGVLAALDSEKYGLHTVGYYTRVFTNNPPPHWTLGWLLLPMIVVLASIVLGLRTPRLPARAQLIVMGLNAAAVVVLLAYPTWWMAPSFAFFAGFVH